MIIALSQLTVHTGKTTTSKFLPLRPLVAVLGIGLLATGCATSQTVANKEALLAPAGFARHAANTPERQAMLARLPPNRFVQRNHNGQVVYLYADPTDCQCLYVGNQEAFSRYQQEAHEQQLSAYASEDAAWRWQTWGSEPGMLY
jgi:hypothetical protein